MAATYEKHTLETFKKKLKEGGYKDLGGARRAIGKMSKWTEADREKARAVAAKFFNEVGATATKAKNYKKKTKKKTKRSPKKGPAKKTTAKKAAKTAPKKKTTVKKRVMGRAKGKKKPADPPVMERIQQQKMRIGTIHEALEAMRAAKELGATAAEVTEGAKAAQKGLINSVNELCSLATEAVENHGGNSSGANMELLDKAAAAATASEANLGMPSAMATPPEASD